MSLSYHGQCRIIILLCEADGIHIPKISHDEIPLYLTGIKMDTSCSSSKNNESTSPLLEFAMKASELYNLQAQLKLSCDTNSAYIIERR